MRAEPGRDGDVSREHLTQIGGTGVFGSALRESLLRGEVDFAVHSLEDLLTRSPPEPRRGGRADAHAWRGGADKREDRQG